MNRSWLNKSDLAILNRKSLRFNLAEAEKDYFLAVVSRMIYRSPLKDKLVFKGGTAIHHCYLAQSRFSEDLDFTSVDPSLVLDEIRDVFLPADFFEIKDEHVSKATIRIDRLKYRGPLGLPNSLKIEVDCMQNVVLPAKKMPYKNAWKIRTHVMVMDEREICAEKIRAASDRSRYRDFYDLYLMRKQFQFDMKEVVWLVRQKEIRRPISKESMLRNFSNAAVEREQELSRVYYAHEIDGKEIEVMIKDLPITGSIQPGD